jgi:hypothetical protein
MDARTRKPVDALEPWLWAVIAPGPVFVLGLWAFVMIGTSSSGELGLLAAVSAFVAVGFAAARRDVRCALAFAAGTAAVIAVRLGAVALS